MSRQPTILGSVETESGLSATLNGRPIFAGDEVSLVQQLRSMRELAHPALVVTINVDQVLCMEENPDFRSVVEGAELVVIDGTPILWLARALGVSGSHRHTGADLLPLVAQIAPQEGWSVVIAGGDPTTARAATENLNKIGDGSSITYVPFPYLTDIDDPVSADAVAALGALDPDVVFLCLGSPKQELWFNQWRDEIPGAVYIGAGAAVDFAAKTVRRAPVGVQRVGLEWFWRLAHEPRRLAHRYLVRGPRFAAVASRSIRRSKT